MFMCSDFYGLIIDVDVSEFICIGCVGLVMLIIGMFGFMCGGVLGLLNSVFVFIVV